MVKNRISNGIVGILRSFVATNRITLIVLIVASTIWGQTYEISGTIKYALISDSLILIIVLFFTLIFNCPSMAKVLIF